MIVLSDIWRTYEVGGEHVHALAGVTETIRAGEYVAIMGPSGSGKSTLLNIIGLLDRPTRGTYTLDGREVSALVGDEVALVRRDRIGYVFQAYHLVDRLTAVENVALPMVFAGIPPRERRERALAALERVGVAGRAEHRPNMLSGGERQRVAVARATILGPSVLIADEPTGNLDSRSGEQVLELLDELCAAGQTILVVTHDPAVARRAQRVLVLRDGSVARRMRGDEMTNLAEALAGAETA